MSLHGYGPGLVAIFVGGTSGIGESTARAFAQHTVSPRIYLIGRNEEQESTISHELQRYNQTASVVFLKKDVCNIRAVDEEGLDKKLSLHYYSRMRFIVNLIPQLAEGYQRLSRVVSVLGAGGEGPLIQEDLPLKRNYSLRNCATHAITMTSLSMEVLARAHPSTSFIHTYPGTVNTNLMRDMGTVAHAAGRALLSLASPWVVSLQESGRRHLYISTSKEYSPPLTPPRPSLLYDEDKMDPGAAYLLDYRGFSRQNQKLLSEYLANGTSEEVWKHTVDIFTEVCGDKSESK
ncbi:Oxidoreductase andH [Penicillium rolfsii]|nr:Oxidoreductase andH [Penicillium rolfsii]